MAEPAGIVTDWSPSSPAATKSRPPAVFSVTSRRTVRAAVVAPARLTVKAAFAPSVTGDVPAVTVTTGSPGCGGGGGGETLLTTKLLSLVPVGVVSASAFPSVSWMFWPAAKASVTVPLRPARSPPEAVTS